MRFGFLKREEKKGPGEWHKTWKHASIGGSATTAKKKKTLRPLACRPSSWSFIRRRRMRVTTRAVKSHSCNGNGCSRVTERNTAEDSLMSRRGTRLHGWPGKEVKCGGGAAAASAESGAGLHYEYALYLGKQFTSGEHFINCDGNELFIEYEMFKQRLADGNGEWWGSGGAL